jgi:hypothetical protein
MSDAQDKDKTTISLGKKTLKKNTDKPIKRRRRISRRKPGTKPASQYFTMGTQDAIVRYQESENPVEKEVIYVKEILPAYDALVENLINVYGFKVMHESKQDLKAECLEFLYTAVHKFDPTKGSKAFSYFNVVAKNWLTIKSKQNAKKLKQYISLDFKEGLSQADSEAIERHNIIPGFDDVMTAAEIHDFLQRMVDELEKRTRTDNEKATIAAIKIIIERLDDIDLLSKRAVLLYIREITGLTSKQLSIVLSSLKKHYRELRKLEEFSY